MGLGHDVHRASGSTPQHGNVELSKGFHKIGHDIVTIFPAGVFPLSLSLTLSLCRYGGTSLYRTPKKKKKEKSQSGLYKKADAVMGLWSCLVSSVTLIHNVKSTMGGTERVTLSLTKSYSAVGI